ncbi:MAG: FtsX-like permease family protein [Bacteroidota bacterium]
MLLQLAWRNIWRNKRRTLITIGAIAFAVFLASFMRSFQKGVWDTVIDGAVNQFFGYVQIHGNGYWQDQTIDNSIEFNEALAALPQQVDLVEAVVPRIESFALASSGNLTAGVLVLGIDPEKEQQLTGIADKIIDGTYLSAEDNAVMVASGLAEKLGLGLNDTLVIISQGYHGVNAAGKYPINAIFEFGLPDLNKRLIVLPLKTAGIFYGAESRITTLALKINDRKTVPLAVADVKKALSPIEKYEVLEWPELIPELVEARQLDEAGGYIVLGILYLLITFAIFGTILMMTKERSYEFGVLTAIGMQRSKLFSVIWLETIIVAMVGVLLGVLMSTPIVYYFHIHPLDMATLAEEAVEAYEKMGIQSTLPTAFELGIFLQQALVIFLVTSILAIYPLITILKLKPIEAMRN